MRCRAVEAARLCHEPQPGLELNFAKCISCALSPAASLRHAGQRVRSLGALQARAEGQPAGGRAGSRRARLPASNLPVGGVGRRPDPHHLKDRSAEVQPGQGAALRGALGAPGGNSGTGRPAAGSLAAAAAAAAMGSAAPGRVALVGDLKLHGCAAARGGDQMQPRFGAAADRGERRGCGRCSGPESCQPNAAWRCRRPCSPQPRPRRPMRARSPR